MGPVDHSPPSDLVPTSVIEEADQDIWIEGHSPWIDPSPCTRRLYEDRNWWHDAIKQEDRVLKDFLQDCMVTCSRLYMKKHLQKGNIIIAADGSFHPVYRIGTAGMTIETDSGVELARGYGRTPGLENDLNSYRSELAGVLMGLQLFKYLIEDCNVQPASCTVTRIISDSCTVACDNLSCVDKSFWINHFPSIQHQHFDLLWAIYECCRLLPIPIQGKHMYGHQSAQNCIQDQLARMNNTAYCLAKAYLQYCITAKELPNLINKE